MKLINWRQFAVTVFSVHNFLACVDVDSSSEDEKYLGSGSVSNQDTPDDVYNNETCKEGEKRTCHVTFSEHANVVSCFVGIQLCIDGSWSECGEEN